MMTNTWYSPSIREYEFLKDVKIVYETDRYDGPLSGHAWYQGRYCYFDVDIFENKDNDNRIYNLYDMTKLETMIQLSDRCLFQDIVGLHSTTGLNGKVDTGLPYHAFYSDEYIKKIRIRHKNVINKDSLTLIGKFI